MATFLISLFMSLALGFPPVYAASIRALSSDGMSGSRIIAPISCNPAVNSGALSPTLSCVNGELNGSLPLIVSSPRRAACLDVMFESFISPAC